MQREDLPAVARLMEAHLLRRPLPGGDAEAFLAATLLDHPWAHEDLPSLVAEDEDGSIAGFIGAQARRFTIDGRPARGVLASHLIVEPGARTTAVGVQLVRRLLAGPQELTWSDTGVEVVVRLFRLAGGHADHARATDWMLVLRPGRWIAGIARGGLLERRIGREVMPAGGLPLHAAGARLMRRAHPPAVAGLETAALQPGEAVEHAPAVLGRMRLHPAYDEAQLGAYLRLLGLRDCRVFARSVRRNGRVIGWYVAEQIGAAYRVLQIVCDDRHAPAVLDALLADARDQRVGVVSGRLEPHLHEALAPRLPVLGLVRSPIIHARDAGVREAVAAGSALLTRLDGEWWVL